MTTVMTAIALTVQGAHKAIHQPILASLRPYVPIAIADWRMYRMAQRFGDLVAGISAEEMDKVAEDDLSTVVRLVSEVIEAFDQYLLMRGDAGLVRSRVRTQRNRVAEALDCIKRGYAPGQMPSDAERVALAERRLAGT